MIKKLPRRRFLKGALSAGALYGLAPLVRAAAADIAQGVSVFADTGPNVLLMKTADGVVLVDSGAQVGGELLLQQVRALAPDGKVTLFNTHWHDEQVGGNEALGKAGATIIAHEKTKLHLATDTWQPEQEAYKRALPAAALPTQTIYTTASLDAGGATIDYGHLQSAHTDGDIYVFFRNANVLAVGDVVSPARDPELDWFGGGWIGGRVDAMDLILSLADDATTIVPAFGPVVSRADVQAERDMMQFLYDKLVDQIRLGMSAQDSLDTGVMNGLLRTFTDPYKFLYDAHKGLWAHHNKLAPNIV
jgi:glyoxylase-like metal-dependent hydrolase (beta-lactamase superfamily II)